MPSQLLWADGDPEFAGIARQYFNACGFDVVAVSDALQCLTKLKERLPDVLILDDGLAWGGVEGVLDWLNQEVPPLDHPLVVISGSDEPDTISRRVGVPAAHCLQKPFRMQSILDSIRAALHDRAQ